MKKIIFISLLLMSSMGFSQFSFDFSATTNDNWKADEGIGSVTTSTASPAVNGAIGVVTSSLTGQDWQNAQIVLQPGDYKMDLSGTNKILTFNYYSNEAGGGMIKLEGNGVTNQELYFSYSTPDQWVPISLDFTSADGEYEKLIYFPHYGSALVYDGVNMPKNDTKVSYFDDVSAPLGSVIVATSATPTVAAPTAPARATADVVSIYSDAYQNISLSEFPTGWSQGTHTFVQVAGNNTIKATSSEFIGIVSNYGSGTNLAAMEYMHIDYYTASSTEIGVKLVNTNTGANKLVSLGTTVVGEWKSVDIPMSSFVGAGLSGITQFLIDPITSMDVYYDNFYFYKAPSNYDTNLSDLTIDGTTINDFAAGVTSFTVDLTDDTTIVPTIAATKVDDDVTMVITQATSLPGDATIVLTDPNNDSSTIIVSFVISIPSSSAPTPPERNTSSVVSVYSDAYDNIALSEFPAEWSQGTHTFTQIAGNNTIYGNPSEFIGIVSNYGTGTDLSAMEFMHMDYFTGYDKEISIKLVNTNTGANKLVSLGTTVVGEWKSVEVPMSSFAGAGLSGITQFLIDPASAMDVYFDNFYFYKSETLGVDNTSAATTGIYPNPTNGPINVIGDVYSVTGQKLLENTNNLSVLPSGIYFVRSEGTTSKVIKN